MKQFSTFVAALLLSLCACAQTPIAYYPFNGNANDAAGTNNGTVSGAVLTTDRFGTPNSAYSFNGTSAVITTSALATTAINSFTLEAWVNPAVTSQLGSIVLNGFDDGSSGYGYSMIISNSTGGVGNGLTGLFCGLTFDGSGGVFSTANVWYHVVMVRDAGTTKYYINGVLIGSTTPSNPKTPSGSVRIGGQNGVRFFDGKIDEVKIYGSALTSAQVQAAFASSNQVLKPGSGNALSLDGTDDHVTTDGYIVPTSGDFTVDFWVFNRSNSGYREFVSQGSSGSAFYIGLDNSGTGAMRAGDNWQTTGATLPSNQWVHVALTKSGSNATLYLNGIQVGTQSSYSISTSGSNTVIGKQYGTLGEYPDAAIDEVRIWDLALTQAQIRARMCHKITSSDAFFTNLKAYYNFDESTGTVAFDGSVNGSNGTLTNGPTHITSGAAIGNTSNYNYVSSGLPTANISYNGQDNLAVNYTSGTYSGEAGTHVYAVGEAPNTTTGLTGFGDNNRYFGVFNANMSTPQYTAVYSYTGNPFVSPASESTLALFKRTDNAATTWSNSSATLNTTGKTLTATGQNTEYVLGSTGSPLPIHSIVLAGNVLKDGYLLKWNTVNERNTQSFVLQVSTDGREFRNIANIPAIGVGNNNYQYVYSDLSLPTSIFYRLHIFDNNGANTYSNTVFLKNLSEERINLYPNPVSKQLTISGLPLGSTILLQSIDGITLQQVITQNATINMNMDIYPAGIYFLKYSNNGIFINCKVFKQ